jgi:DNA polymerase III delta subunit
LSNEDVLKKLVESVKDMKFADASKNESWNESLRYTVLGDDVDPQSETNKLEKRKAKKTWGETKKKVVAYLHITDGKNINQWIKSTLVRNLKVICVWKPDIVDWFRSILKSVKNN